MPRLFVIEGYLVYFWTNEAGEPIHVHVAKKRMTQNGTKFWLLSNGDIVLASKNTRIPHNDLRRITMELRKNNKTIRDFWIAYMGYEKYIR